VILFVSVSCRKYNSLGFTPGTGAPTITSVHTLSKTDTTAQYDTVITYDASGNSTKTIISALITLIPLLLRVTRDNTMSSKAPTWVVRPVYLSMGFRFILTGLLSPITLLSFRYP